MQVKIEILYTEVDGESSMNLSMDTPNLDTFFESAQLAEAVAKKVGMMLLHSRLAESMVPSDDMLKAMVEGVQSDEPQG